MSIKYSLYMPPHLRRTLIRKNKLKYLCKGFMVYVGLRAPLRVSWLAASPPGIALAPASTVRLYRGWWKLHSTSTGQTGHPWRNSTPSGVGRRPTESLKTPTTQTTNWSACYCLADGTAAPAPAPPGSGTASSLRPWGLKLITVTLLISY